MAYDVGLTPQAKKGLAGLSSLVGPRIAQVLRGLGDNPRPHGCKKLKGGLGWAVRVGDYRVIYLIDDDARMVSVMRIGPRGEAYRGN